MAIKKTVQSIQHLRNTALTADKQAAIAALSASTLTARDGEIILNRYGSGNDVKTIFAINYVPGNETEATGHNVTIFDFDKEALDAITAQIHTIDERIIALSGDSTSTSADTSVEGAKEYTDDKIATLDYSDSAVAGQYVSQVTETDGVIAVTRVDLPDLAEVHEAGKPIIAVSENKGQVAVSAGTIDAQYVNVTDTADVFTASTVEGVLKELDDEVKAAKSATTVASADGSIAVATAASGTDISVVIKSGEKVLAKDGGNGLYTDLDLIKITGDTLPAEVKERYQLLATDNSQIGVNIDIYKDSSIVSITYITNPADAHYQNLEYVYIDASGNTQTEYVDVSSLVLEAEFASGVGVTNHVAHGVVDPTSETFLTVGADGFKLAGVQDAIDAAVAALDVTGDTAVAGQYVAAIEETDGVVAVKTRANVSEAVLNNYSKGSDATDVAATDTINQAISKLENQIDVVETEAAASKTIVKLTGDVAATDHLTISSAMDASNSALTFTLGEDNIASQDDLAELSGKAVTTVAMTGGTAATAANADGTLQININADGSSVKMTGYAKGSDSGAVAATDSVNVAVGKLENQIDAAKAEAEAAISGLDATITAETGYYINKVDEVDGKISGTTAALPTVAAISGEGQAITAVSQSLGTVAAQYGDIAAAHVTVADAGNLFTGTTVEAVLAEVDAAYKAADAAIVGDATTSGNTLGKLEDRIDTLEVDAKEYSIVEVTTGLPETVKVRYELHDADGHVSGDTIDIPKDSHIVSITYITDTGDTHYQNLEYKYLDASGVTKTEYVDMSELVLEAEFASGVTVTDHIVHGVVDSTSEKDSQNNAFLTVGTDGFKVAGIKDEIAAEIATEIAKLDATAGTQTVAADKHVAVEVVEADGKVTAVTVAESDIASASALTAEIAARKAVDGQTGDTYNANASSELISGATSLNDADVKLNAALVELSGKVESSDIVAGNGIQVTPSGDDTEVAVKLGGEPTGLSSALEATSDGLHFTGIIDAGTY